MHVQQHPLAHGEDRDVFGIMVHTTGSGPPKRAWRRQNGYVSGVQSPMAVMTEIYEGMKTVGPHFAIDPFGGVVQYRSAKHVAHHCRMRDSERRPLLDGHWRNDRNRIEKYLVEYWDDKFPNFSTRGPAHLYPSRYPNTDYIGIEMMPCGHRLKGKWTNHWGTQPNSRLRHSQESYITLCALIAHLCKKWSIPLNFRSGRIVGHEDINPYTRPGWDPGAPNGNFDWKFVELISKGFTSLGFTDLAVTI